MGSSFISFSQGIMLNGAIVWLEVIETPKHSFFLKTWQHGSIFHVFHRRSTYSCSNVATGRNVYPTSSTGVWILALWRLFCFPIAAGWTLHWSSGVRPPSWTFSILWWHGTAVVLLCQSLFGLQHTPTHTHTHAHTSQVCSHAGCGLGLSLARESIEHKAPRFGISPGPEERSWFVMIRFQFHGWLPCVQPICF